MEHTEDGMDLTTYLFFAGQCEAAFKHYEQVLGGRIVLMLRYADAPPGQQVPGIAYAGAADRIMHARLVVGGHALMGSDYPPGHARTAQGFRANISVADPAEAERIFHALGEGGTVSMPLAETFFAHRFGMLEDRFGTPWMINCEKAPPPGQIAAKPFVTSRELDAPRDLVWKAFTEAERMKQWWGPKGVTIIASRMDLRPGGTYHYGMWTPDGKEMWGRFVYREIEAPERLVSVNSFSDAKGGLTRHPLAPAWPIEMLSTFTFVEANGKTTFTVTWSPLNPTAEEQATFDAGHAGMTQGWSGTMEQLAAYLAKERRR